MDNYSDINLKGGSKIKVGDSLTISDSGILGSDNKPKYLEVEYVEGNAVIEESKVCIASDFSVIGDASFSSCVEFKSIPKVDASNPNPTEDNQLATKKYVDSKASSSGCSTSNAIEYETKTSIGSNNYHYDIGENSFEASIIAATGFCVRQSSNDVNAYVIAKKDNGFNFHDGYKSISLDFTDNSSEKIALESYVDAALSCLCLPSGGDGLLDTEQFNGNYVCIKNYGLAINGCLEVKGLAEFDTVSFQDYTSGMSAGRIASENNMLELYGNNDLQLKAVKQITLSSGGNYISTPTCNHGSTETEPNVLVTSNYGASGCGLHMVVLTQSEYDQMSSHDMTTLYFISGC